MGKLSFVVGISFILTGVMVNLSTDLIEFSEVGGLLLIGVGLIFLTNLTRKRPT